MTSETNYTPEQLDEFNANMERALLQFSAVRRGDFLFYGYGRNRDLTTEQLAQILADNAHRLRVWSPPSLDGVASVSINGDAVQLNIETGSDDD